MPERQADIHVEQLPSGYWLGRVTIKVPQLPAPHVQENDLFHSAIEAFGWAIGVIDLFTRGVSAGGVLVRQVREGLR